MAKKYKKVSLKFKLLDQNNNVIGYEYHESNIHGVVQVYHQDIKKGEQKKLLREGHSIVHYGKDLMTKKFYSVENRISPPMIKFKNLLSQILADCANIESEVVLKEMKYQWRENMQELEKVCKKMLEIK